MELTLLVGGYAQAWALGPRALMREIGDCQRTLASIAGQPPRWYRSVVGMTNPFAAAALRRHGLARVGWSARGFDGVACQPAAVTQRIVRDLVPGAIVLLHSRIPAELAPPDAGWQRVWEGSRPGDRKERFRLYRRVD